MKREVHPAQTMFVDGTVKLKTSRNSELNEESSSPSTNNVRRWDSETENVQKRWARWKTKLTYTYGQKLELIKALNVLNEGVTIGEHVNWLRLVYMVWVRVSPIVFE